MKVVLINIVKFIVNAIYYIFKIFPAKKQILFMSMQANSKSLDFELLSKEIEKNDSSIKQVFLCKKMESSLSSKKQYISYIFNMIGYFFKAMYYLSTSKVCITESYIVPLSILKHKKMLKIIQIWHASGAVKKFGYQSLDTEEGKSSEIAKLMCMHKNYDYAIAPSKVTKKIFSEAFNMPEDKILMYGLPRLEYISNKKYDKSDGIYKDYPELKNKKIILYVPTFRKGKKANLSEILDYKLDKEKYKLIIRLHPLEIDCTPEEYKINSKYTTYDLIKIADYIITDYSILSIEASILNKPIFLYLYDFDEYKKNRGVNIKLEEELKTFTTFKFCDIMRKIEKNDFNMEEIKKYRNKYIEIDTENATLKLSEMIINLLHGKEASDEI